MKEKTQWPARAYSVVLLGASGYTGSMTEIATCVGDDVANVRIAAGKALEELCPLCSAAERAVVAPLLQPLLDRPDDWRKTAVAARSVGPYATAESVPPLVVLLSHTVLNVREGASHSLAVIASGENGDLRTALDKAIYPELEKNEKAWEFGAHALGALRDAKAVPVLTRILSRGDWRAQGSAALAVAKIAADQKINDKPLSDALIQAAQSEVLQTQDAANKALRVLNQDK
jgi:HEAT repeat protein